MATLQFSELKKYNSRWNRLLIAIKIGFPLELSDDAKLLFNINSAVISEDNEFIAALEKVANMPDGAATGIEFGKFYKNSVLNFPLKDPINNICYLPSGKFKKTTYFGSIDTNKQEEIIGKELETQLDQATDFGKNPITIDIISSNGTLIKTVTNITSIKKQNRINGILPKADFNLCNSLNEVCAFISHKFGNNPKDFGQWSGLSKKAGERVANHPEVICFGEDLNEFLKKNYGTLNEFPKELTLQRSIKDEMLKYMALFGHDYDEQSSGPNNVDIVTQGSLNLLKLNDTRYILTSSHISGKREAFNIFGEKYEPALCARYALKRTAYGIKNLRASIYAKDGRLVKVEI